MKRHTATSQVANRPETYALRTRAPSPAGPALVAWVDRREKQLVDAARREGERAADERAAVLMSKYTAVLRGLEQLAGEAELGHFLSGHILVETSSQLDAATGVVIVCDVAHREWRIIAHVEDGRVEDPPYRASLPLTVGSPFGAGTTPVASSRTAERSTSTSDGTATSNGPAWSSIIVAEVMPICSCCRCCSGSRPWASWH